MVPPWMTDWIWRRANIWGLSNRTIISCPKCMKPSTRQRSLGNRSILSNRTSNDFRAPDVPGSLNLSRYQKRKPTTTLCSTPRAISDCYERTDWTSLESIEKPFCRNMTFGSTSRLAPPIKIMVSGSRSSLSQTRPISSTQPCTSSGETTPIPLSKTKAKHMPSASNTTILETH